MKLLQEREDATSDRKYIKSQVEKRRRERMNCSLERLRTMLVQEPQQLGGTQSRVEKAEILEHTVLFLQKTTKEDTSAEAGGSSRGRKHSFRDGVSTCLQQAAQFLGPEGKGLWLGAALDASFAARVSWTNSDSAAGLQRRTDASSSSSLSHTKSILRKLRQKSKQRLHAGVCSPKSFAHPYRLPAQQGFSRVSEQAQRQNQLETQSCPVSQTLWRPWP
ncbi:enhancer of split mgamma protein-like [Notolabrus celidotus]|uniref:enhancer of split mgamma protein-like n=1 Tax=Notolabrus celidotus TaxID=1203425 RepID=UPI0014907CD7|nr:enhancer of split mgamma protein-like [Notolabrus celidotus]